MCENDSSCVCILCPAAHILKSQYCVVKVKITAKS